MGILDLPPGSAILGWPPANYENPETRGRSSVIGCLVLTAICMFAFCMRLSARALRHRSIGPDDWLMMFSLLPTLGLVANAYLAITLYDFDRHLWDIKASNFPSMLKITFADELLYTLAAGFIKVSVLTTFLRSTSISLSTPYKYLTWVCMASVVAHMMIFIEELFLNCIPFEANFVVVSANQPRQCVAGGTWAGVRNVISVVQAFLTVALAIGLYWNVKVEEKRQKLASIGVLAFGVIICFIGLVRYGYFHQIYFTQWDWSWLGGKAFMWSAVECLLGTFCACLPTLNVYAFNTPPGPISIPDRSSISKDAPYKDEGWRKFSMNESGIRNKTINHEVEPLHSSTHTGRNQAPYGGGGRRRSRVPSMAHIIMEKD